MRSSNTNYDETPVDPQQEPKNRLEPPAPTVRKRDRPFLFIIQVIYLVLIVIPVTIYSVIEYLFFTKPKSLKGKVVLVTGSGRGLGQGFAMKFAELGCKIACVDIDEDLNKETEQMINQTYPGKAKSYICNVAVSEDIETLKQAIYRDFDRVDILVNNAGLISGCPVTDLDNIYIQNMININLTSHFSMIREFLPDMLKRNEGHIVAISSLAGFSGLPKECVYAATKHGVMGLMEALHYELQGIPGNNVQTSVICSWFVNTSATYVKWWDMRFPELSISDAVNTSIAAIRKNKRVITIPCTMYFVMHLMKLLPDKLNKIGRQILHTKINFPPMESQKALPAYRLLMKSKKRTNL